MIEPSRPTPIHVDAGIAFAFCVTAGLLLSAGPQDYPHLHAILDTVAFVLSGVLAASCWDMGRRSSDALLRWVAVVFCYVAALNFVHVIVSVEWTGTLAPIASAQSVLRPSTWPPAELLLPLGIATGLALMLRGSKWRPELVVAFGALALLLLYTFYKLPRYTEPVVFGITRPALIANPVLWAGVIFFSWRARAEHRLMRVLVVASVGMLAGDMSMLFSEAPHDAAAMVAHLGKCSGYLAMLLGVMQMAAWDMQQRIRVERELAELNSALEQRVCERTSALTAANLSLEAEIGVRKAAERKITAQLDRLNLLQHITRAVSERQDLQSIFQVVLRHIEDSLPIDFGCVCIYDASAELLQVTRVGAKSEAIAAELTMTEQSRVPIDANGLSRCVRGQLVYEPDISQVPFPFPQRLAAGGMRSLVAAPLLVESKVFGVLIAARADTNSFSSGDCEFLRQLSEHTALAAHQSQLHTALQLAYDDLHRTQLVILQQERLRALGQMASGIAHDINNAISPVALYTDSLSDTDLNLGETTREYLDVVRQAVKDVTHTVSRMREFYRQSSPDLALQPVDVNRVVPKIIDFTRARWSDIPQQRGIVIHMSSELAPESPLLLGIESEVREALINLVFNSIDAMPDGGNLTLRTALVRDGNVPRVTIEVQDTGIGMDEDTSKRCLEPFFTTKGERGTGLGLAMVYGIVQRHGGDIEITSVPNKGTTVSLSFPGTSGAPGLAIELEGARPPRLRILVIDDDPLLTKAMRDILEKDGHLVTTVNAGQAGIDAFRASHGGPNAFAIVVTDLGMPYVDGRQVAQAIKMTSSATPVVLLTGWGQRLVAEGDFPAHVDRILNKPPKLRELRRTFVELFGRQTQAETTRS